MALSMGWVSFMDMPPRSCLRGLGIRIECAACQRDAQDPCGAGLDGDPEFLSAQGLREPGVLDLELRLTSLDGSLNDVRVSLVGHVLFYEMWFHWFPLSLRTPSARETFVGGIPTGHVRGMDSERRARHMPPFISC